MDTTRCKNCELEKPDIDFVTLETRLSTDDMPVFEKHENCVSCRELIRVNRRKESQKKYRENNKEKIAERTKEYRDNNKEKIAERKKEYRDNNKEKIAEQGKKYRKQKVVCECGSEVNKGSLSRHRKSKKHLQYVKESTDMLKESTDMLKDLHIDRCDVCGKNNDFCRCGGDFL